MGVITRRDRQRVRSTATYQRARVGARVRAAASLAGLSLHQTAQAAGLHYSRLVSIVNGREPMTDTDGRDLALVLCCPEAWLRRGWDDAAV